MDLGVLHLMIRYYNWTFAIFLLYLYIMSPSPAEKIARGPRPVAAPREKLKPPLELVPNLTETQKYLAGIEETASEILFARYGYDINQRAPEKIRFQKYIAEKLRDYNPGTDYPPINHWVEAWMAAEHADVSSKKTAATPEQLKKLITDYGLPRLAKTILQLMEHRRTHSGVALPDELISRTVTLTSTIDVFNQTVQQMKSSTQIRELVDIMRLALVPVIEYGVISAEEIQTALKQAPVFTPHA